MIIFNTVLFVFGFAVLALQPLMPLNSARPRDAGADDDFSQRHLVHDEHRSAALLRRSAFFELQPDLFLISRILFVGIDWLLCI